MLTTGGVRAGRAAGTIGVVSDRGRLRAFERPTWRSAVQVATTAVGLVAAWLITDRAMAVSLPLGAVSSLLVSMFTVRAFIIFHDCGHGSFTRSRRLNTALGTVIGVIVFTPFAHWTRLHSKHHATTGDLDRRGDGDVWTMTTDEFRSAPRGRRRYYRLYHNPVFLLSVGPLIKFAFVQRRVTEPRSTPRRPKVSVYVTNAGIVVFAVLMALWMGPARYIAVQLMVLVGAGVPAVYLFYVQHCFHGTYWRRHSDWDYADASLASSSRLSLPTSLQWVTGNIGYHHVHHLAPRIPNYRLPEAQAACPEVKPGATLTLRSSFAVLRSPLWDEAEGRYVTWAEAGF
jgi:omega-6 fatty acid desaturase (delta-12 desaturase)